MWMRALAPAFHVRAVNRYRQKNDPDEFRGIQSIKFDADNLSVSNRHRVDLARTLVDANNSVARTDIVVLYGYFEKGDETERRSQKSALNPSLAIFVRSASKRGVSRSTMRFGLPFQMSPIRSASRFWSNSSRPQMARRHVPSSISAASPSSTALTRCNSAHRRSVSRK